MDLLATYFLRAGFLIIFVVILLIVGVISFGIYFLDRIGILESTFQSILQTLR